MAGLFVCLFICLFVSDAGMKSSDVYDHTDNELQRQ